VRPLSTYQTLNPKLSFVVVGEESVEKGTGAVIGFRRVSPSKEV
jgi:hypothetical protein